MKLEELREKLEGVSNLDKPEDCKRVIEMLLRDLEKANGRAEDTSTKLKMLAYLVSKDKPTPERRQRSSCRGQQRRPRLICGTC